MKGRSICKVIAICGAVAFSFASAAQAQVTGDDAKCRATMNKGAGKYASTANKAVIGCFKDATKGKNALTSCTDPQTADTKGKVPGARQKLVDSAAKCAALPPSYVTCPSPGTVGAIGSTSDLGNCLSQVVEPNGGIGAVETFWNYILRANPQDAIWQDKDANKCINSITKNAGKLFDTVIKTCGKLQAGSDKGGGPYAYQYDATCDDKGKIGKSVAKLNDAIAKACTPAPDGTMTALQSCTTDISELGDCIAASARKTASGVSGVSFSMPGVCPASVTVVGLGTVQVPGENTATSLSVGQSGLGHNAELPEGFRGAVSLDCAASSGTCDTCAVTASCAEGNCRCDNDPTALCDEPFGPDADDCAGNDCILFFAAPLPLSAGGAFTCVVNEIPSDLVGTANIGTGQSNTAVANSSSIWINGTQSRPCPVCEGDPTPNDGVAGGTCSGGQQDGGACDANFINPVFGNTSYDCQPTNGQSVATLSLQIDFSDTAKSKQSDVACTSGDPAGCPCNVCSSDPTIPCDSDVVCANAGAGTCTSAGPGAPTVSNGCDTLDCGADGFCADGTSTLSCDGFTKQGGGGIIGCTTNADCTALDAECPGGSCGNCTLLEPRACFPNPIVNDSGVPSTDGAILTAQFCVPPSGTGVDQAAGTPGAGDLTIQWDFVGLCDDGSTVYELGGNNCPPAP